MRNKISKFLRTYIRPNTPKICRKYYKDVKVKNYSLIDPLLGAEKFNEKKHKVNLIDATTKAISKGDNVLIMGGGRGISAVNAARKNGSGKIIVYECSPESIDLCRQTFSLNDVDVSLVEKAVGNVNDTFGSSGKFDLVSASSLPECDILEMDCEGAEKDILNNMTIRPDSIIVETHPKYGSDTDLISDLLNDLGYSIVSKSEDRLDGHVLYAKKS